MVVLIGRCLLAHLPVLTFGVHWPKLVGVNGAVTVENTRVEYLIFESRGTRVLL